jgi:hypothetical protein
MNPYTETSRWLKEGEILQVLHSSNGALLKATKEFPMDIHPGNQPNTVEATALGISGMGVSIHDAINALMSNLASHFFQSDDKILNHVTIERQELMKEHSAGSKIL